MITNVTTPMPKYRCFKEVWALKIEEVHKQNALATIEENPNVRVVFQDKGFADRNFNLRGKPTPEAGWWYIQYEDGYESFSPAKAFEEGYMPVSMIPPEPTNFQTAAQQIINKLSLECQSHTPDFILAQFVAQALYIFQESVKAREKYYGRPAGAPTKPPAAIEEPHPFDDSPQSSS